MKLPPESTPPEGGFRPAPTEDLVDIFREPDGTGQPPAEPQARPLVKRSWRFHPAVIFVAGLLVGWLVIGWLLWPVQWSNSDPWQLSPKYQRMFVSMVAEEFWKTSNLSRVGEAVGGWNRDDLTQLLSTMQRETVDAEARRRLAALSEALKLPGVEGSSLTTLLGQQGILISVMLAAVPLLVAAALVVSPLLRKRGQTPAEELPGAEEQSEQSLEELLTDVSIEEPAAEARPAEAQQAQEIKEEQEREAKPEEDSSEQSSDLGDLASLFEEEDTSLATLEAFCKGMPDFAADDLLANATQVRLLLRQGVGKAPE